MVKAASTGVGQDKASAAVAAGIPGCRCQALPRVARPDGSAPPGQPNERWRLTCQVAVDLSDAREMPKLFYFHFYASPYRKSYTMIRVDDAVS